METYPDILQKTPIFTGISPDELSALLDCLSARKAHYPKGSFIHHHGDTIDTLGIVLSGCVHILKEDFWGNTNLLAACLPSDIFGESYAIHSATPLEVSVLAYEASDVLFLNIAKVLTVCSNTCRFHSLLITNLLSVLTDKNFQLSRKLEHITKRTTREKLLSYLSGESVRQNSADFTIPFNRQQLADYLSVDRSAMSNELSHLKAEGILSYHKNSFTLL